MNNILEAESVSFTPDNNSFLDRETKGPILNSISFKIERGKILGIAGESGSGKTTLAKVIAGICKPGSGKIKINKSGNRESTRVSAVQLLFQNNGEILNPFRKIYDVVNEAVRIRNRKNKNPGEETEKIFSYVNFSKELWDKKGFQLSGGEQQRAALARTLALMPELLILDEPFSAQDPESQLNFTQLFKRINTDYGISMICISHNLKILKSLCDDILIMYKGEIVEQGNCTEVLSAPGHPYTKYLLKAEDYDLSYEELKYIPES